MPMRQRGRPFKNWQQQFSTLVTTGWRWKARAELLEVYKMEEIRLWSLTKAGNDGLQVQSVDSLRNTETEADLEETLVAQPALLEEGLHVVGRQVATANGPLDLIGIDRSGRLVVFELKRGVLAREAVAQIIDYASDLDQMDRDDLARHIESHSGRGGIPKIEDFDEWYNDTFPENNDEFALSPRMVLVGLGIDSRAVRMVRFLAKREVEIDVLTFHAFRQDGQILMARQVEVASESGLKTAKKRGSLGREARWNDLLLAAEECGVRDLLNEMREHVCVHLHSQQGGATGKTGITFYKRDFGESANGPGRAYVSLNLDPKRPRSLILILTYRAVREGGKLAADFVLQHGLRKGHHWLQKYEQFERHITPSDWPSLQVEFANVLEAIHAGVRTNAERVAADTSEGEE